MKLRQKDMKKRHRPIEWKVSSVLKNATEADLSNAINEANAIMEKTSAELEKLYPGMTGIDMKRAATMIKRRAEHSLHRRELECSVS